MTTIQKSTTCLFVLAASLFFIGCERAVTEKQASKADTISKEDWRSYSIEELIDYTEQNRKGGWTHSKIVEVFGQPDRPVTLEDFRDLEVAMIYNLKSGLIFRIVSAKDTKTKRYGKFYFMTFELIDPQYEEGDSTIWTANESRPLSESEQQELGRMFREPVEVLEAPGHELPPTDTPPSKLDGARS